MQLREVVARDKHSLRRLREEHARLQDSLKSLQGKSKQGDIDRNRLNAMKTALFAITETQKKHNIESDEMKLALIKKELGSVMEWNSHVAAMVAFLQAQQGPVMKQQVAPVVKTQSRSKSPIRHWTP
jgi:DNA repair ATPase RecN